MPKPIAVILASGGLDSAVTTAIAKSEYELAMLHINYGQKTEKRELRAFRELANHYQARRQMIIELEHLRKIGGSSLTDPQIEVAAANLSGSEIPDTYVPFRNANILAIATSWAETLQAEQIFIGAVAEDGSAYPDCRREFYDAFEAVIDAGTKPQTNIKINTPIIHLKKEEIVQKGAQLQVPFQITWSCYQSQDEACGVCDSCGFRLRGFQKAQLIDPIPYRQRPDYR